MKNLYISILLSTISLLTACGGGSSGDNTSPPIIPSTPPPTVEKTYSLSDFFEVTGNEYTYTTLRLKYNSEKIRNIQFSFQTKPENSNPWFSYDSWRNDNQYRMSFDKAGKYIISISYYDIKEKINLSKNISIEIKDSNIINLGMLKENIVLSDTSRPYALTGGISIPNGLKLTINPGVTINGNRFGIQVEGNLELNGTKENPITIYDSSIAPQGSRDFDATIRINYSNLIGTGPYSSYGNRIGGTLELTNSFLYDFDSEIYLWVPSGPVKITGNYFKNTGSINWELSNYDIVIENNKFENWYQESAINVNTLAKIQNNTFVPTKNNDKFAISFGAFHLKVGSILDATNNYWGTTDENQIKSMIIDRNDGLASNGYVIYSPYLTEPNSSTPK